MAHMAEVEDIAELRRLLRRLTDAIERGDLEASPAHLAALFGADSAAEALQQTDV